jgi:hypothetical protein
MSAIKRTGRRGRPAVWYTCSNYRQRGTAACGSKGHGVEASELHGAIVAGLTEILQPEKLDTVLQGLAREWASQHDDRDVQRAGLQADLATVDVELKNLTAALAGGAAVATVLDGLREREARKRDLRARLDALDAEDRAAGRASEADHLAALRTVCKDWRTLLRADAVHGRRVLRDLRIDRVLVRQDERGRWWFRLEGNLDKILGITGRDFAVTDEPFAAWTDEPDQIIEPGDPGYQEGSCPRGATPAGHDAFRKQLRALPAVDLIAVVRAERRRPVVAE